MTALAVAGLVTLTIALHGIADMNPSDSAGVESTYVAVTGAELAVFGGVAVMADKLAA